jgi:hypothetical protein
VNGDPNLREMVPGLYEIGDPPFTSSFPSDAHVYSYLLTLANPATPGSPLTLGMTWDGNQNANVWNGWYLFLTEPIADPSRFVPDARAKLPQPQGPPPVWRSFTWLVTDDPASLLYNLPLQSNFDGTYTFSNVTVMFEWGDFALQIGGTPTVSYPEAGGAFLISGPGFITFFYGGQQQNGGYLPYDGSREGTWNLTLPAAGPGTGGFQFNVAIDPGNLTLFLQCGLRYFYPAGGSIADLYYTFAPPVAPSFSTGGFLGYLAMLQPLLTDDPAWSMLILDTTGSNAYQTNSRNQRYPFLTTITGKTIVLTPNAPPSPFPAGWAFCKAPQNGSPGVTTLYLAPSGTYQVLSIGGSITPGDTPSPLMCGLSGQEYLEVQPGDLFGLRAGRPAYAPQFSAAGSPAAVSSPGPGASPPEGMSLAATYTTSWLQFPVPAATGNALTTSRFFGQPSSSVYYSATGDGYSAPVESLLAELAAPTTFPLVPYTGTYASQQGSPNVPVFNLGVPPSTFAAFEAAAISSDRHAMATVGTLGPRFIRSASFNAARRLALFADDAPFTSLTPQGFVVESDAQGAWQRLLLARDPGPGTLPSYISFDAGTKPTVSRDIANAVLAEQLFLVVSDNTNLGQFENTLTLQGFNFTLDVASGQNVETILIFKFNTKTSLRDMAQSPDLWASRDQFVSNLPLTQQRILEALADAGVGSPGAPAPPGGNDPFRSFRELAEDPLWTGILALGCAIDGNGMPPDLQMLLGGINGRLRAHHLGVASNRVTTVGSISKLEESSLFGVILYPMAGNPPPPPPPVPPALDYNVELLQVVFANSAITQFSVEVGLTINNIFGRDALKAGTASPFSPPINVLNMPGQYQTQGPVGVVLFQVERTTFDFPIEEGSTRVLEELSVTSGSLSPVSTTALSPAGTHMVARFALAGTLKFAKSPFPSAADLDIFSFDALPYTSMTITMVFDLDAEGALVPGSRTLVFDPALMTVTSNGAVIRQGSFLGSLPLQVSGLLTATDASPLSTSKLNAQVVHSLQLEGHKSGPVSPASPVDALANAQAPSDFPYVTASPSYALQFAMPLGNLGALSDVVSLTAMLLLGWGPSPVVPAADAAAVFVQLPQLSAGYGGFNLQGILKTTFGDANLLKVELPSSDVYAVLFNNIKLSVLGFSFPPGVVIDFLLFAGQPDAPPGSSSSTNTSNIAWYLSAQKTGPAPDA